MTAATMQPDRPPPRIRHSWRCTRRAPLETALRVTPAGETYTVHVCTECRADDLPALVLDRHTTGGGQ